MAPSIGMSFIAPWNMNELDSSIYAELRIPRALLAALAGGGLAMGGMAFQALFRNALATPFTLGVSSGAALGAALYIGLGLPWMVFGFPGATFASFIGALGAISLVYGITLARKGTTTGTLLLAGVAASMFFSSALLAVQSTVGVVEAYRIFHWLVGSLESADIDKVKFLFPFTIIGAALLSWRHRDLNLLLGGEEMARSRGVDTTRVRRELFFVVSLMVGAVVSFCGPIGFVGLIVPHACRMILGPDHRWLLPASLFSGAAFLSLSDAIGRSLIPPVEIPVGVITALLGGPFFLWLLLSGGRTGVK